MKHILTILLIAILFSCKKSSESTLLINRNDFSHTDKNVIKYKSCEELISNIIKSSNANVVRDFKDFEIRIEDKSIEKITIELFVQNDVSEDPSVKKITNQTVAWLEFFPEAQKLQDVTNDNENPITLQFDKLILKNVDIDKLCGFSKTSVTNSLQNNFDIKGFEDVSNKTLVGLSIINEKDQNIFKKYGIDFTSFCMCNSPSLFIDFKNKEVLLFNYCDASININEIKNKHILKISKVEIAGQQLLIKSDSDIAFFIKKIDNKSELYQVIIEGKLPSSNIGNDVKSIYTTIPEKFTKIDCGDFEG